MLTISLSDERTSARDTLLRASWSTRHNSHVYYGVRKIRKGRPGCRVSYFASRKNSGLIPCESEYLELAACQLFESDQTVARYRSQPVTIELDDGSRYTPDFLLVSPSENLMLVECKRAAALRQSKTQARIALATRRLVELGVPFRVMTENDCRSNEAAIRSAHPALAYARLWR